MCVLTANIAGSCKDGVAGIKKLWAIEQTALATQTESGGVLTGLTLAASKNFFSWGFAKDSAEFKSITNPSIENGTTFWQHQVMLGFWKVETAKRNEIKLAAVAPLTMIVLDYNGQYWILGKDRGLDLQAGAEAASGRLLGDKNGYTLSFMGDEPDDVIEITDATIIAALP